MRSSIGGVTATLALWLTLTSLPARFLLAQQCPADCTGDGVVNIDELVRAVGIALGNLPLNNCPVADVDRDGVVRIEELVRAVSAALSGCPAVANRAYARQIADASDLIGGPLAVGRVGDYLIGNERIRAIIRNVGRQFSFMLTYGGNIVDADLVRPRGEPGRDNWGAMTPLINIASTANVQQIEVINDGANGQPAVLRTRGVDDLFDPIDPTNAIRGAGAGAIPGPAQDRDIPVEIVTEYTLAPGDNAIRIETRIRNNGPEPLRIYAGDYLNGSGELDTFSPSLGFGEAIVRVQMPFLAYTGIDSAAGISYGVVPENSASAFGQSGVTVYVIGQTVLDILIGQQPGFLSIEPGGTGSYVRHFVVGQGVDDVARKYYEVSGRVTGSVRGRVTVDGRPLPGATVTALTEPGDEFAPFFVHNSFITNQNGEYEGSLPVGEYSLLARAEGHPYDSNDSIPNLYSVSVTADREVVQNFELPETGHLRVIVRDENDNPIPARVTVVGFQAAPDPTNVQTVAILRVPGFVFNSPPKEKNNVPHGIVDFYFLDSSGDSGTRKLAPGTYEIYVSRGPEYSVARQRVLINSGQTHTVNARIVRVLDTTGFVSADYHVHMINSPDSTVRKDERILTMVAENVEYFVASDHDFLTDLENDIARLGLQEFTRSVVSSEITTFNLGHYNAWPLRRDPTSITGGSPDWGRAGVEPGMDYPSLGSFDLSPAELMAATRALFPTGPQSGVLQINHINDTSLGFFHTAGIDTARTPPQSFTDPRLIRQNPAITNLYSDNYDSLELWIEANRSQTARLLEANLGDWFNLLNQGIIKTGTANSDTHSLTFVQAGGPRNWVASSTDAPAQLDHQELARSVREGRVIGSSAPFVRVALFGDSGSPAAGLILGQPRMVRATGGVVNLRVDVQSPIWADFDTIEIYTNVVPTPVPEENFNGARVPRYAVAPTAAFTAGQHFTLREVVIDSNTPGAARFEATLQVPLNVSRDGWVMVVVKGTDGVSRPLWPMNPKDLDPTNNQTLDALVDGNRGEGGNPALAFTNPLFFDVDGNGQYDPPGTGL